MHMLAAKMMLMSAESIASMLLDPVRLMVAGSLAGAIRDPAEIAKRTGSDTGDVIEAISELRRISFVQPCEGGFTVPTESWDRLTSELSDPSSPDPTSSRTR